MNIFRSFLQVIAKALPQLNAVQSRGGWWPIVGESYAGAWQQNVEVRLENVMTFAAVYACVTVPANDIAKLRLKLMQQDLRDPAIWREVESAAFSPVLRKPNHFQNRIQFLHSWIVSKRMHGNTYVLMLRDQRQVVVGMYVLDPTRVRPLVAPNGDVYYELKVDHLSGLTESVVYVPAREIMHDRMNTLYHPLVGISPISACGLAAVQGLNIQNNSSLFFSSGSNPGGVLTAPGSIAQETADRLKAYWDTNFSGANVGKVAVLGDGLKYEQMTMTAVDSQLIEQLKWTAENVCTAFHMPRYKIQIGNDPTYNNIDALNQQYYSETLQEIIESIELLLDEGLGLTQTDQRYGVELDVKNLSRMDTTSRVTAARDSMRAGMTINEVRSEYFDLPPVNGGDTVYLQEQDHSLEALNRRDQSDDPFGTKPSIPPPSADGDEDTDDLTDDDAEKAITELVRREMAA